MALDVKEQFQVEKVTGKFRRTITKIVEETRIVNGPGGERKVIVRDMKHEPEDFTEGYMLYFPQGHSLLIAADDTEQLERLEVLGKKKLIDMETGEEVPDDFNLTPKAIVERRQKNRPRSTGGLSDSGLGVD